MRRRIFAILFVGIALFTAIVTSELVYFLRAERSRLIDQQVEVLATSLLATGVLESRFEEMQSQLSKSLGTREMVAFLSVYDTKLNLRYRNPNAQILLGAQVIAPKDKWSTISVGEHKVRLLNLKAEGSGFWIQVGMLIDQENSEWNALAARAYFLLAVLLLCVMAASYFLSRALLLPLSQLAEDLRKFANDLEGTQSSEKIFQKWSRKARGKDAFSDLVYSLKELRDRLMERLKVNDATLSQMAHEFKTPLSVISAGIESLLIESKSDVEKRELSELLSEADRLAQTITSFLDWSRATRATTDLRSSSKIDVSSCLEDLCASLDKLYPGRLDVLVQPEVEQGVQRSHFEQIARNLISNALKYTPISEKVDVILSADIFEVRDRGEGISVKVLRRLGEPFNSGNASGTGLGLAWVKTLCELYAWDFTVKTQATGTSVVIRFRPRVG